MPVFKPLPTQRFLQECFTYNSETGELRWRQRPRDHFPTLREYIRWNGRYAGTTAGRIGERGYRTVAVNDILYRAHRIIWKMMTGEEPPEIDHRDVDRRNNRWLNLRRATHSQNGGNRPIGPHSKTGFKGVYFDGRTNKFGSRIFVEGRMRSLGHFATAEQAHDAYCQAARQVWGEFWHP
jgi:HNH endonuclease/AP2 domain